MSDSANGNESDNSKSDDGGSDSPKYMTTEQFNRAFSAREKAFEKKLSSLLDDKFSALAPAKGDSSDGGDGDDGGGDASSDVANALKSIKSRLTKMENDNKLLRNNLSQEREQASTEKMRRQTLDFLAKNGIQGTHGSHAMGHLIDSAGKVRLSEDGTPVFFNGEFEEPLEEGLSSWASGDDSLLYRPPKPDQGSGEHGGGFKPGVGASPRDLAKAALSAIS